MNGRSIGAGGAVAARGTRYGPLPCEWLISADGKRCGRPSTVLWIKKLHEKKCALDHGAEHQSNRIVREQRIKRELCPDHALCVTEYEHAHASSRKVEF